MEKYNGFFRNNSTSQTLVLSCPLFSFGFFSSTFLDPCSSINPTLHHLFSTHSSSSFSESISIPRHCKGASRSRAVIWQILPFSIVGLVVRPGHVRNKFEPCMVVAHVLFADDESRGDYLPVCLFSLPCHGVVFPQFLVFPARSSSFDLRHRPSNRLGSASPPQVDQSFQ